MKKIIVLIAVLMLPLNFSGCARQKIAEENVENKISQVSISDSESSGDVAQDFIMKSEKLTADQKEKLLGLNKKSILEAQALKEKIEKARIVLIQTVLDPKMNTREYKALKKKIIDLEKQRIDNEFKAAMKARAIIEPKDDSGKREFYKSYMGIHFQGI